jgi:broad specificity phosphatase PhoE
MRRAISLLLLFASVSALAAPPKKLATVIIVRHAEKTGPTGDVPLNDAGRERAKELARVVSGMGVKAIYVTQYIRTQQTAEPLAAALKLRPIVAGTTATYPADLVKDIDARYDGGAVVVVSHSNLIPDVLRALGIENPPPISDTQYDDLFIVVRPPGAAPALCPLRYGFVAR